MFFFPGLNTQPVWSNALFPDIVQTLKENKGVILAEYQTLLKNCPKSDYEVEYQHKRLHQGNWDWHSYVLKGNRQADFAVHCPQTVSILESFQFPRLMTGTPFSFAFFSTMHPNTSINSHSSPCNLRLRCHFPLLLPKEGDLGIRIADKTVRWQEGEPIFFDDCYDHEGNSPVNSSK
jgi:aspartyl/asparaginyl beta-hydroxylase (cupin superfamily)